MEECTRSQRSAILPLIESFEDDLVLYVVTKFLPAGDLLNYLIKQPVQPLSEPHARKIVIQVALGI